MAKATKTASPENIVMAALAKAKPVNGYRKVPVEGTMGRLNFVQAPDGHTFLQWNNGPNPKSNLSFGSLPRVTALKGDIDIIIRATEVAEKMRKDAPVSHLAEKTTVPGIKI